MLSQDSEDEIRSRFAFELAIWLWQDELNPRVRCAFGNVFKKAAEIPFFVSLIQRPFQNKSHEPENDKQQPVGKKEEEEKKGEKPWWKFWVSEYKKKEGKPFWKF